jgi:hypothetical protein
MGVAEHGMRIGVLVPCRNEARVIERKLRNLAVCAWPRSGGAAAHRICVVDDGSEDATAELARARGAELFRAADGRAFEVVPNRAAPGKCGAIHSGLAALGDSVDLIVLTDADVVLEPDALVELAHAFAREPRLGMACAAQRFVRDLAADGTCRAADLGALRDGSGRYDRWTARIRAFESRRGRLYSVHGQCLCWRTELGLAPRVGYAADDLDLMLQARARGVRIELVPSARFCEQKTRPGPLREQQALRRARAYFQVVRDAGGLAAGGSEAELGARVQRLLYRHAPGAAPWCALALAVDLPLVAGGLWGAPAAACCAGLLFTALATSPGWRLAALLVTIARAMRLERRSKLSDRWEMARG